MSTENYLQIYDDNVVKFSIKQGMENDRWPITGDYKIEYSNANTTALKYENNNNLVIKKSETQPGAFTIAELACTRDTNRVFVGNFSNELGGQQQTVGGALVGNKYLGFIDSKPVLGNDADSNAIPVVLSSSDDSGLLEKNSAFRSYNHAISGNTCELTEDKTWSKQSYYNSKYDAYDGDYMYDIYRNALIIFDHNIKPSTPNSDGSTVNSATLPTEKASANNRRVTPLIPYSKGDDSVKDFTKDMYGDGYVLLYNVIPDGNTLTFSKKKFEKGTGTNDNNPGNYSQNIIKLNKVPIEKIIENLDTDYFTISDNKITLQNLKDIGSGSGGTNGPDLTKGSLKNIYDKTITANSIIISDASGCITANSGIPTSLFTGIKTEKTIEARLSALENKSSDGTGYATTAEFNSLKKQVEDYHKSGAPTSHSKLELIMTANRAMRVISDSNDSYSVLENPRSYISTKATDTAAGAADTYKDEDAIEKGIILLTNKRIKVNKDGFIVFSVSNATIYGGSKLVMINLYSTNGSTPLGFCRCLQGAAQSGGCSCTIPVYAGETYEFVTDNWDDDSCPYLAYYIF